MLGVECSQEVPSDFLAAGLHCFACAPAMLLVLVTHATLETEVDLALASCDKDRSFHLRHKHYLCACHLALLYSEL